ncbi:FAD binding domain-containing protein [Stackebrandtia nassauensis]
MDFHRPATLTEALEYKARNPGAVPIAGGTDIMVELNFDVHRPAALLDLNPVTELAEWGNDGDRIRIGACVPYSRVINELGTRLPGLAIAARTVGSPQIRNRGTLGGNLGAASPAGDGHPPLVASGAHIELSSVRGVRRIPAPEFFTGVKRNVLEPDELITAILVPAARGPQQFAKIGTRNAMVIAVCAFALSLDPESRGVGTGIGSAAPTPRRATSAETFLSEALDWEKRSDIDETVSRRFGRLTAEAASPIDDVRGSAAYRRHALSVMARRTLGWAWKEYQCA